MAFSIPKLASTMAMTGAIQLVVQEALLMISPASASLSSLTPITIVWEPSPLAGALMITLLAPALMWALAFWGSVKKPVDSITMATPRSFQGRAAGFFS